MLSLQFFQQGKGSLPEDNPYRNSNIKGMLCAELWDFDAIFRGVDGFLLDAFDFIAENESVSAAFLRVTILYQDKF